MGQRITIFTPAYNRAYILDQLYQSLKRQTVKNFEWLVVDDGSSDQTAQLFEKWSEETEFPVRYYKTENGGKHRAVNRGLDLAEGEFFMVVDSDDYLTDDAVEKLNGWLDTIKDEPDIMGVVANKGTSATNTENPFFKADHLDKTLLEMSSYEENHLKVLSGERAICFRTEFHRKYKYPEFEGEKFVTEAVAYNRMAHDGYKMRFYNDIIWIYEYKEDGLTKSGSKLFLNNPHGYGLWLREKAEFTHCSRKEKRKMIYTFTCDLSDRYSAKTIAECIGAPYWKIAGINMFHKAIQKLRR